MNSSCCPKNFRQYLETILFSATVLRMGIQKIAYQRTYDMQVGSQDFTVDFLGLNKQFGWIEISPVFNKSDKQLTIYDRYNAKCAARLIKLVEFTNISKAHSATNTKKLDMSTTYKNFCYTSNLLRGTATTIQLPCSGTTSATQCFKNSQTR